MCGLARRYSFSRQRSSLASLHFLYTWCVDRGSEAKDWRASEQTACHVILGGGRAWCCCLCYSRRCKTLSLLPNQSWCVHSFAGGTWCHPRAALGRCFQHACPCTARFSRTNRVATLVLFHPVRCLGYFDWQQTPGGLRWPPAPEKHQSGTFSVPDAPYGGTRPLTVLHAFDWRFHNVKWKLDDLRNAGCVT